MNAKAFAGQIFRIRLEMDDSPNAKDTFSIDKHDRKILHRYADPGCFDVLDIVTDAITQANKKLRSFKYRIGIEWQQQQREGRIA